MEGHRNKDLEMGGVGRRRTSLLNYLSTGPPSVIRFDHGKVV